MQSIHAVIGACGIGMTGRFYGSLHDRAAETSGYWAVTGFHKACATSTLRLDQCTGQNSVVLCRCYVLAVSIRHPAHTCPPRRGRNKVRGRERQLIVGL